MNNQSRVPFTETQRSSAVSDTSINQQDGTLAINNLIYKQPKALSLSVNRTFHRQYFQRDEYKSGQTAIVDWNSGTRYVSTDDSYLRFTVTPTVTAGGTDVTALDFGTGSALNFIKEIKIRTRSGVEVDRLERANFYNKIRTQYVYSNEWKQKFGRIMGFKNSAGDPIFLEGTRDSQTFCIPVSYLCGFFRPTKKQLIPPQIASGLQIQIIFEDTDTVFTRTDVGTTSTVDGYVVSDIQFMLSSTEFSDDVQKTINMESANNGLEYCFNRVYTNTTSLSSSQKDVSIQVRKAVSMANSVITGVYKQSDITLLTADSLGSVNSDSTKMSYRLGSLYWPDQGLTDTSGVESYVMAQQTFDKLKLNKISESSVGLDDYKTGGAFVLATSLEKDTGLNLSGLPINNSRVMEMNATFTNSGNDARELLTFLEFVSVCKVFLDNCSVAL